ncbi:MAG: SIR2 family protein, partial [Promethearchaeota archaeon]
NPDWLTVIHYALVEEMPLILGQQIQDMLGDAFIDCLKEELYRNVRSSTLIEGLGRLCKHVNKISHIITYNYDDLIECELSRRNLPFNIVTSAENGINSDVTNIVHIHGYLPQALKDAVTSDVVLGEARYYELYNHPYDWVNIVQLATLLQYDALFIGFSFNDPNVRRLLGISHQHAPHRHRYAILRKSHPDDMYKPIASFMDVQVSDDKSYKKIVNVLAELSGSEDWLYSMQADLYNRLGLDIVWVQEHSEMPDLLDNLCFAKR